MQLGQMKKTKKRLLRIAKAHPSKIETPSLNRKNKKPLRVPKNQKQNLGIRHHRSQVETKRHPFHKRRHLMKEVDKLGV